MELNKKLYIYVYIALISINTFCIPKFIKKITQNKFSQHGISTIRNLWSSKYIKYTIILSTLTLLIRSGFNRYKKNEFIKFYKNNGGNESDILFLKTLPASEINKIKSLAIEHYNKVNRLPQDNELIKLTNNYIQNKMEEKQKQLRAKKQKK